MTPQRFTAGVSFGRTAILLLLGVGMTAASIWVALCSPAAWGVGLVIGAIGALFFGFATLTVMRQLFRSGPVLDVSAAGIRWARWSDATIPWSAIVRAESCAMQNQRFLCLWLRDPSAYPSRGVLGRLAGANKAMGFGDIALSAQGLDQPFDALVAAVRAHAPRLFAD